MCIDWVDKESLMTELHAKPYWREGLQWQYGQFAEQNPSLLNLVIERKYSTQCKEKDFNDIKSKYAITIK